MQPKSIIPTGIAVLAIFLSSNAVIMGEEREPEEIYKKGSSVFLKLRYPMPGFVGGPPSPAATPISQPRYKDDFEVCYVRLIIMDIVKTDERFRIIVRIDKVDMKGGSEREGLYYAYLEKTGNEWSIIQKISNDGGSLDFNVYMEGMPFPLGATLPVPLLGKKGILFSAKGHPRCYFLKTLRAKNVEHRLKDNEFEIKVYDNSENIPKIGVTTENPDRIQATTRSLQMKYKEIQHWNSSSWIWKYMKRVDDEGNLMLECTTYNPASELFQKNTPSENKKSGEPSAIPKIIQENADKKSD